MTTKLLLDTNVLIDLVTAREPYVEDIRKLCIASTFGDVQLWTTIQSYTDAYYVLRKFSEEDSVKRALIATLEMFLVCGLQPKDLRRALESDWDDIEDYLIAASGQTIPADFFITRDSDLIERSTLTAMNAHDFLEYLKDNFGYNYDAVDLS